MSMFKKAVKESAKLRLAIAGPSGSGKTYTSLAIASELGGPIAVIDTEHGSASKYADLFEFDVAEMHAPFHPDKYIASIKEAADAGYNVIILDSMTHAWEGTGGVLDIVDEAAKRSKSGNTYMAWKEGTPVQNRLINAIVQSGIHVIATIRSKTEYVLVSNNNGKQEPKKVGMKPQQRDGFEYEYDVFLDMDVENNAIVSKSRCPELSGRVFSKPGKDVANILAKWLSSGEQPAPQAAQPVAEQPKQANPAPKQNAEPKAEQTKATTVTTAPDKERKAFHAEGVTVFADEWDQARPHVVSRYTTSKTPTNKRTSSNDLTAAELGEITGSFKKAAASWVSWWTETKAHAVEQQPVAA